MPTIKQRKAVDALLENTGNVSKSMRQAGYAKATAKNPKELTESKGFQELLAEIDDQPLLDKLKDIALDKNDKRANLQSIDMILKLKNRYPKQDVSLDLRQNILSLRFEGEKE